VDVRVLTGPESAPTGELDDDQLLALYAAPRTPWLRVNMVTTLDGAATGATGRSGSINNDVDHRVFTTLRRLADAVVVGAGTARVEGYRPLDRPLVVVTRSGALPPTLAGTPPGSVLVATCRSAGTVPALRDQLGADHVLVHGDDTVDLAGLRTALTERGLVDLLSEGGPHLLADLLAAGVVDELCATVVPLLVAGDHPRITAGPPVELPLELRLLLEERGTLLGRWLV